VVIKHTGEVMRRMANLKLAVISSATPIGALLPRMLLRPLLL
jgi:hypothetical protein